jgi:hypothetical protein
MKLVPRAYRPSRVVRRTAVRRGVFGPSAVWKGVAALVYGGNAFKSLFGKQPERIDKVRLRTGEQLIIRTAKPMSRREQRRTGITRATLLAQAEADVRAAKRRS